MYFLFIFVAILNIIFDYYTAANTALLFAIIFKLEDI